jgi:cell division protein FtsA
MIPVNGPGEEVSGPNARGADDKNRIPRAELVSVVTQELGRLTDQVGKALKEMQFSASSGGQVVLTGGGAELAGFAEFAQGALGRPVRIGKAPQLRGLPEAHAHPGFATLAGLCLYAAADPVDIRAVGSSYQPTVKYSGIRLVSRVFTAVREYF